MPSPLPSNHTGLHFLAFLNCNKSSSATRSSEAELGELLVESGDRLVVESLLAGIELLGLLLVELGRLLLSLLLEGGDDTSLGPASVGSEVTKDAELSSGLHSEALEGVWDDHSLLLIVWEWAAVEALQSVESSSTSWSLVWEHATDDLPEDAGWSEPVLGTSSWVGVDSLLHDISANDFVSGERARLEDSLTSDDNDSLAADELLGNNASKAALKMALTVND